MLRHFGLASSQLLKAQLLVIQSSSLNIHKSTILQQTQYDNRKISISTPNRNGGSEKSVVTKNELAKKFQHFFMCSEDEASLLVQKNKEILKVPIDKISLNIEILYDKKVVPSLIMENLWILGLTEDNLKKSIRLIEKLNPRKINDFIPLVRVPSSTLSKAQKIMQKEKDYIPERNRIYYFSKRLNVNPSVVSKYFATHMFMINEVAFDQLVENLNVMLEYNVSPIDILRDLWAFKYLPTSIRARLERCHQAKKGNLKPWMIRCPENILEKSLSLSRTSQNLLGDKNVIDYLSERLQYDMQTMNNIVSRHEAVLKVRVTRMKDILDYLLIEENYKPFEIANTIRILCHSLATTKARLNQMKEHDLRPSSLVIVCKTKIEFNKCLKNLIDQNTKGNK